MNRTPRKFRLGKRPPVIHFVPNNPILGEWEGKVIPAENDLFPGYAEQFVEILRAGNPGVPILATGVRPIDADSHCHFADVDSIRRVNDGEVEKIVRDCSHILEAIDVVNFGNHCFIGLFH